MCHGCNPAGLPFRPAQGGGLGVWLALPLGDCQAARVDDGRHP